MKLHRFTAANIQKAMMSIQDALGAEALIYSTRRFAGGVEILASLPEAQGDDRGESSFGEESMLEKMSYKLQMMDETVKQLSSRLNTRAPEKFFVYEDDKDATLKNMKFCDKEFIDERNVCALVGPTGIGKTTTIAKLAKRYISRYGTNSLGLITIDCKDITARNHLFHYSQQFNVDLECATNSHELALALHGLRNKRLVLIDTYGVSQRDSVGVAKLLGFLESQKDQIASYVTLPCNVQEETLYDIASAFSPQNTRGCILTKQDECSSMTAALNVCLNHQLSIAYLCNGQNITTDIEKASAENIYQRG